MTVSDEVGPMSAHPAVRTVSTGSTTSADHDAESRRLLTALLQRPRYEVLAVPGTAEQVEAHVPGEIPITVTSSPRRGIEPTLALTEDLARRGRPAVPHLAARLITDESHVAEILQRLDDVGVTDVFVVSGDGEPVGHFTDSLQLLATIASLRGSGGAGNLRRVGIAGYPEGHPLVSQPDLERALVDKQSMAGYLVTQMCFDAAAVLRWVQRVRRLGVRSPVYVGVAGPVDRLRLMRVGARIGVGTSLRLLRKQHAGTTLLRKGGYRPDDLLGDLAASAGHLGDALVGVHVYTLGNVAATEQWRLELLERLAQDARHG